VSVSAIHPPPGNVSNLRRSQRLCVSVDVVVTVRRGNEKPASEETKTLIVSAHGALILLRTRIAIGEVLNLRNVQTGEERACRVVNRDSSQPEKTEVGLEFVEPAPRFWRVAFPPADWTPRSPEAKSHRPQIGPSPLATKKE
jgi:hypothetical protein